MNILDYTQPNKINQYLYGNQQPTVTTGAPIDATGNGAVSRGINTGTGVPFINYSPVPQTPIVTTPKKTIVNTTPAKTTQGTNLRIGNTTGRIGTSVADSQIKGGSDYVPTNTPPAPGSVAGLYAGVVNPDQARIDAMNGIVQDTSQIVDPAELYKQNLANYQEQINAINAMYADQLNQARIQGQGRIESRQFAQGRAGQIGSGTGEAGINMVQDANTQVYNAIEAEKANAIASIYGKVRSDAAAMLAANTAARKAGAEATLKFLNEDKPAMKKKQVNTAVTSLVSKGITDIKQFTPDELKSYLDGLGVSKDEFIAALSEAKTAQLKAAADLAKEKNQSLPASAQEYEYAKANGYKGSYTQYQNEDANRKARAAGVTTPKVDKVYTIAKGDTLNSIAAKMGILPDALIAVNPAVNATGLMPGQKINLPTNTSAPTQTKYASEQEFLPMLASPAFKSMSEQQKKDYILSQGHNPATYGY